MITDGGLETDLIFNRGFDLPQFAAFPLVADEAGRAALVDYYGSYLDIARTGGVGLVLESPTWRANPDWAPLLGYSLDELDRANRAAIDLMTEIRAAGEPTVSPVVISGCVGPRGDGYVVDDVMKPAEAHAYHERQIGVFADAGVDMVAAVTMTYADEAIGIARAAREAGVPAAISFTVETDGRLPSGQPLSEAIAQVDEATDRGPAYFMINCAHPEHFEDVLDAEAEWATRIMGIRANASRRSHAELDEAEELDEGNPAELGAQHAKLRSVLPHLTVLGGCCGTDHRHVGEICSAWLAAR
jgi:S-methylmethionine-dependent homocysteine/selenocysteine methylase